jgi:GNAT superfamily N-acetyltransferase
VGTATLERHLREVHRAYCTGLGAAVDEVTAGRVVVVARPEQHWGFRAVGVAFADSTLLSVAPHWLDRARELAPEVHHHRVLLDVLSSLRDTANADGEEVTLHAPAMCWALGDEPSEPGLPEGLRFEVVSELWLNERISDGRFENGAGQVSGVDGRTYRNQFGVAVLDESDHPVAVAGVFLTYGLREIGIDVVEERRGEGIGRALVASTAREIVDRGYTPFYGCAPTNLPSVRTALSVGFVPVLADTTIT